MWGCCDTFCPCFKACGEWIGVGGGGRETHKEVVVICQGETGQTGTSSAGARAKGRGERHSQQTQMVPPALLMPRQTALWAVFEPQTSSERLSFPIPVGNLERLSINIFVFTAGGQVKVILSLCKKLT